jgi:hypothetical protein
MTQRWEHRVYWWGRAETWQGRTGADGLKTMLTSMGAGGWELVSVTETAQTGYTCFFKRPTARLRSEHDEPVAVSANQPGD